MATIYLIRHGQASLGMANYDELSETGIEQSKLLGTELLKRGITFDRIISGTMQRHQQTATHCLKAMNSEIPIVSDSAWNEFDHRDVIAKFEPRYADMQEVIKDISATKDPKQEMINMLTASLKRWTEGKHDDYNESWVNFCNRVENGLQSFSEQLDKKEKVLVFTSGGSICVILKKLLNLSPEKVFELQLNLANASISQLKNSSRGIQLISFNDHAHFQGETKNLLSFR